ncbi:hypothetical protein BofuT4_uP132250.1 [Botrytis cinerea T4]|uniref:Uncharacterized protein n=1 Tax=Botryotinia fuckeliana (strain T4) TaxID=999810 RepID=G2YQZ7_BOTF4|nr:hypothetical protein BofuT4_uP132250.1 [Botrytis cinerea T4]
MSFVAVKREKVNLKGRARVFLGFVLVCSSGFWMLKL